MTTSSFSSASAWRIARITSALFAVVLPVVMLALVVGSSLPESWWPQTGHAFAADQPHSESAGRDPCHLIVGPAEEYCERGRHSSTTSSSSAVVGPHDGAVAAWMLIPPAVGLAAVVAWRRRGAAGRRRR